MWCWQWSQQFLHVLIRNCSDFESGLAAYFVSVLTAEGWPLVLDAKVDIVEYAAFPVQLEQLQAVKVKLRAVNHAGREAVAFSQTVTVDSTPPVFQWVCDGFGVAGRSVHSGAVVVPIAVEEGSPQC